MAAGKFEITHLVNACKSLAHISSQSCFRTENYYLKVAEGLFFMSTARIELRDLTVSSPPIRAATIYGLRRTGTKI